jgi:hypothetical protein
VRPATLKTRTDDMSGLSGCTNQYRYVLAFAVSGSPLARAWCCCSRSPPRWLLRTNAAIGCSCAPTCTPCWSLRLAAITCGAPRFCHCGGPEILTLAQVGELATLHSRDVAVAAWFGWLWLAGFPAAGVWFAWFMCWYRPASSPGRVRGLMASPATGRFWLAVGCGAILGRRFGTPAVLIVRSAATSSTLLGRKGRPGTIKRPYAHATS